MTYCSREKKLSAGGGLLTLGFSSGLKKDKRRQELRRAL